MPEYLPPYSLSSYLTANVFKKINLVDLVGIPKEAAVGIFYYVNVPGFANFCAITDLWNDVVEGDAVSTSHVSLDVRSDGKGIFYAHFGEYNQNPNKDVLCGIETTRPDLYFIGYFTYDEVYLYPELTTNNALLRHYDTDTNSIGTTSTDRIKILSVWDLIPYNFRDLQPQTLIWDTLPSNGFCVRSANIDDLQVKWQGARGQIFHGFTSEGKVKVSGLNTTSPSGKYVTLWGYFRVPMRWNDVSKTLYAGLGHIPVETEYDIQLPDDASGILFELNSAFDYNIGGNSSIPYSSDGHLEEAVQIAHFIEDDQEERVIPVEFGYVDEDDYLQAYFLKWAKVEVPQLPERTLTLNPPSIYYTPDNFATLHLQHSVTPSVFTYSSINDLKVYYSGGSSNNDPEASLGGAKSSVELTSSLNSLFSDGTHLQSYLGVDQYRCVYVENTSGSDTAGKILMWIEKNRDDHNELHLGLAAYDEEAESLSNDITPPAGIVFRQYPNKGDSLLLPVLPPSAYIGVWIKRTMIKDAEYSGTITASLNLSVMDA